MLKIFKVLITGIEDQDGIGINTTVRTTMGYDQSAKEISVLVEKVVLPEIPTDRSVELRDPHTTATFTTLLSKTFTVEDFPKTGEFKRWQVDYDVIKNELVIFDAYEYSLDKITGSQSARKVGRFVKERYNSDLIPLFALDNVYKSAADFTASVLTFYTDEQGLEINDTILTGAAADAEIVTQQEKEFWMVSNVNTTVYFEVLDTDGKILSSVVPTVKNEAKSSNFVTQSLLNLDENHILPSGKFDAGNQYKVSLPVAEAYDIRIVYSRHLGDFIADGRSIPAKFNIETVNGLCNKSVSISAFNVSQRDEMLSQHTARTENPSFSGLDNVRINTFGLATGDYIKLKLNLGNFKSYAELWIELT